VTNHSFLYRNFFVESFERVFSFEFFQLSRGVLVKEFVNTEEATANSDVYLVLVHANVYFLGTELVNALTLPHEHNLQL
jgi:hypothetical protein